MIVREVINEKLLTLAEVKNVLVNIQKKRANEGRELRYEQRRAIEHAKKFAKTSAKSAKELAGELNKLEKMKPEIAIRIADIMPKTKDELRAIYAKERYTLSEEELEAILNIVSTHA
jgi:DNA-directed RNA polymerase subunit F